MKVFEIHDPTAVGEGVSVISQDAVQLKESSLQARRVVVRLGTSILMYQSTNRPIRVRTVLNNGLVAYVGFGPHAAGTLNGLPVGPELVLSCNSGVEVEFVVAAGYESAAFLVPPHTVCSHLGLRQREVKPFIPCGVQLLRTSPGAGPRLFEWGRCVAAAAAKHPEVFDDPQTNSVGESELLDVLFSTVDSAIESEHSQRIDTRQSHSRVVRIAEDYAIKHAAEHLYVTNLCKAASVSERTLQNAFGDIMGMSPVAYLTRMRLHRVRHALRAATHQSTTVTSEAMKWGFWHLSDFSRVYKECFGELPSETLRQTQGRGG